MSQLITIRFNRHDAQPWGFRLQGGVDFGTPLVVQKVAGGSIADRAGLNAGDAIIKVNSADVYNLRHKDAQDVIVRAGNTFDFTVQRGGGTWRPHVTPTGALPNPSPNYNYGNHINTVTQTSLAHKQPESRPIGTGYNNSARPFNAPQNGGGPVKSIVNKQYNTPVGMYSDESIAETLSAQAEVLANGVLGVNFKKNEKIYNAANSEVLKALHEAENEPAEPERIHSPVTKHVSAPVDRPIQPNTGGLPVGQNICAECERLIVGVFVRIKDKSLHAECFRCATCGTSLKNQGYFNIHNKLYCDLHAKLAAMNNPPSGTEGFLPVPLKPGTKLSANTVSAALTSHHPGSNGTFGSNMPANNTPGYGSPKPFGYQAEPPLAAPRSPAYQSPSWIQPKANPVNNFTPNYNTLPRSNAPQPAAGQLRPVSRQSVGNGRINNHGFGGNRNSYPSYLESNNNSSNAMPKLISHARDRRSYMEKSNLPIHSGYYDDTTEATCISSELASGKIPKCSKCHIKITRGPFITALGRIWCPDHFICVNSSCRRPLQDIGFVEEKGDLYCEYCFEKYLAPPCSKCTGKIKGDCLNAIGKHYHPECFTCSYCGKLFGNSPFFLEEGQPYCEADWNELFTTKCFACGFPVEAGDRWVEALSHNYHSQCFNCSMCKKNLEGQSFFAKNGRPFCKAHAR